MPTLSRIAVYPIKSLDPAEPVSVAVRPDGGLAHDRRYAMVDAEGEYVNGKRTPAVHRIRAEYDLEADTVRVWDAEDGGPETGTEATLQDVTGRASLVSWLQDRIPAVADLRPADGPNLTDSSAGPGPTVIGEETLRTVAGWFDDLDTDAVRARLRPNLVVSGVPPFWEDRLVADPTHSGTITIGDVQLEGVKPVPRCVVPTRDPKTGEPLEAFRQTFIDRRRETLPDWVDRTAFDHLYSLMVVTRIRNPKAGPRIEIGDAVSSAD